MTIYSDNNTGRLSGPVLTGYRGTTQANDGFIGFDGSGNAIMSQAGTNGKTFVNIGSSTGSTGPLLGEMDIVAQGYISTSNSAAANKTGFNAACTAAGTQYGIFVQAGTYNMSSGLNHPANTFRIRGCGPFSTIFNFADHAAPGLSCGDASGTGYGSKVSDIQLAGPTAHPTSDGNPALQVNGAPFTTLHNIIVSNFDIGYDWIANCYGGRGDMLQAQYGLCNVACNLRVGSQSGSDFVFTDCWFAGLVAGVYCAGGTGYHFYGGQLSSGSTVGGGASPLACVVLGKDYLTGTVTGVGTVNFDGCDIEGFLAYGFQSYNACGPIVVRGCTFLATAGTPYATGILNCSAAVGSSFAFHDNILGNGTFSAASGMAVIAGANTNFSLVESGWVNQFPLTINGDSSAWFTSLAEQSNITAGTMGYGVGRYGDEFFRSGTTRWQISATGVPSYSVGVVGGKTNGQTYVNLAGGNAITGYGTPTGGSHQSSFAAGSITLANLAASVAQLIVDLKTQNVLAT